MPPDETRIRIRAYAIWEAEGRPHGRDAAHWHEALRQIIAEDETPAAPPAKTAARKPAVRKAAEPAKAEPVKEPARKRLAKAAPVEPAAPTKPRSRAKAQPAR